MVKVVGDKYLREFRQDVINLVDKLSEDGFSFGYPASPAQSYTDPDQLPDTIHIKGPRIRAYAPLVAEALGIVFVHTDQAHYKGVARVSGGGVVNGSTFEVEIELWDTDFPTEATL